MLEGPKSTTEIESDYDELIIVCVACCEAYEEGLALVTPEEISQHLDDESDAVRDLAAAKGAKTASEISFATGSCNGGECTKIAFKRCATIMNATDCYQACDKYPLVKSNPPVGRGYGPNGLGPNSGRRMLRLRARPSIRAVANDGDHPLPQVRACAQLDVSGVEHLQKSRAAHFEVST